HLLIAALAELALHFLTLQYLGSANLYPDLLTSTAIRIGHLFSQKARERATVESPEGRPLGFKFGRVFKRFAQCLLLRACLKGKRKYFTPIMTLQIH
ncbi:MAG TPA: hypothetical protein DCL66_04845, partial [Gammaproteobacteria bacterium]|nr:hypothetical protein [Gammaproteobacteria bacterium]